MNELRQLIENDYTVMSNGNIKRKSTNRVVARDAVVRAILDASDDYSRNNVNSVIDTIINEKRTAATEQVSRFTVHHEPQDLIDAIFTGEGIRYLPKTNEFLVESELGEIPISRADFDVILERETHKYNRDIPVNEEGRRIARQFLITEVKVELDYYLKVKKLEGVVNLRTDLKYNGNIPIDDIIDRTLTMMKAKGDMEVNRTVFKHFLWTLKRHIYNLPVTTDIWLAIYGGQGVGKNYWAKNVLGHILDSFYLETELNSLADIGREINKFTDSYLINFDELARGGSNQDSSTKLSPSTVAHIKAILTRDTLSIRMLGTQTQSVVQRNFSCMSTANEHIYEIISDPTGMRRFFEIEVGQPDGVWFDKEDMDFCIKTRKGLLRGIDDNNDFGYLLPNTEVWDKVAEIQAEYKPTSTIDLWLEEGTYVLHSDNVEGSEPVALSELFSDYLIFCKGSNAVPFQKHNIYKNISRRFTVIRPGNTKSIYAVERG